MSDRNKAWLWRRGLWCMYCNDIKIHIRDKGCQVYYTEIQGPISVIDSLFKHITYDRDQQLLWIHCSLMNVSVTLLQNPAEKTCVLGCT